MSSPAKPTFTTPSRRAPELQWHNTLPEDFSGKTVRRKDETPHGHKRMSSFPELNATPTRKGNEIIYQNEFPGGMPATISPGALPSPTKRQRGSTVKSTLKTPVKVRNGGAIGSVKSTGSGMATPPPTSTTTARKRGRPPKKKENVPPPAPPTPNSRMASLLTNAMKAPQDVPANHTMQPPRFNTSTATESTRPVTSSAEMQKNIFWEGGLDFSSGLGAPATTSFDWNPMKPTSGDVNDIYSSMASNDGTDLSSEYDVPDMMHFSFLGSDDAYDSFAMSVDPNLIFGSSKDGGMSSMRHELDMGAPRMQMPFLEQPYQHQMLQQQREAMESKALAKKKLLAKKSTVGTSRKVSGLDNPFEPSSSRAASTKARSSSPTKSGTGSVVSDATGSSRNLRKKPTVVFTISPSGRAKTEVMTEDSTDPESGTGEDGQHSLWQDYLDSDSSLDEDVPRGLGPGGRDYMTVRGSKAKLRPGDGSPGRRRKYGTMPTIRGTRKASMAQALVNVFPESSPKLPSPVRASPAGSNYARSTASSSRNRRVSCSSQFTNSTGVFTTFSEDRDDVSEAETVHDDSSMSQWSSATSDARSHDGDALQALKELMATRKPRQRSSSARTTPAKPQSSSSLFLNETITAGRRFRPEDLPSDLSMTNASPLFERLFATPRRVRPRIQMNSYIEPSSAFTSAAPTPTPRRTDRSEDDGQTRCVCNNTRGGGTTMVQCDSCRNWLHLKCIGLNRKALSQVYVCGFCTGGEDEVDGMRRTSTRGLSGSRGQGGRRRGSGTLGSSFGG